MAKLVLYFGQEEQKTLILGDQPVTIGRDPACDLVVDNVGVSRNHARIEKDGENYVIRDLGSQNGTFVNEKQVDVHVLADGDRIFLGKHVVVFQLSSPATRTAQKAPLQMTMQMSSEEMEGLRRKLAAGEKAYLAVLPDERQYYPLDRLVTFIGRPGSAHVPAEGWGVAPKNALIYRKDTDFMLVHLTGRATYLNSRPLEHECALREGDEIRVGKRRFLFKRGSPSKGSGVSEGG